MAVLAFCTGASFFLKILLPLSYLIGVSIFVLSIADMMTLFSRRTTIYATRKVGKLLSLGDENLIVLTLENGSRSALRFRVFDELPTQFQERKFGMDVKLKSGDDIKLNYKVRPVSRGEYRWGNINLITRSQIGLIGRRVRIEADEMVAVFPSIIQMKKFELQAFARISNYEGIKKVRRIGHSYEFEKIKTYVKGDDVRSINWKATGRRDQLMVNQYEDERAQQIYSILDKSRAMHMPFNDLSLLDYAINTSLVLTNIALKKHDKAGLITFSNKIGSTIKAERSRIQLKKILHALYNEKSQTLDANYDLLYRAVKNVISSRSLIFLYLNFESVYAMERALPILKKINHLHLLVVMIFENTELMDYTEKDVEYIQDIYTQTIGQKLIREKKQMAHKLQMYGIQTILTKPEDLSINTVNKYLELKSRGLI